jgi:hypothetical protein
MKTTTKTTRGAKLNKSNAKATRKPRGKAAAKRTAKPAAKESWSDVARRAWVTRKANAAKAAA